MRTLLKTLIPNGPECRSLLFGLPALIVYLGALTILEYAGFGLIPSDSATPFATAQFIGNTATAPLTVSNARVSWLSAVMVFSAASSALAFLSALTIKRFLSSRGFRGFMLLSAALAIVSILGLLRISQATNPLSLFYYFTDSALGRSSLITEHARKSAEYIIVLVNVLASIIPGMAMLAACAIVSQRTYATPHEELRVLRERMASLKSLLSVGSGVLVAGALHTLMWLRWPVALLSDNAAKQAVGDWALSVTLYMGSAYSLMIVSLYVPCATSLIKQAEAALTRASPADKVETDISAWLAKNGFSSSPIHQIPQIVASLAPMLAGPLGSAIVGFGDRGG